MSNPRGERHRHRRRARFAWTTDAQLRRASDEGAEGDAGPGDRRVCFNDVIAFGVMLGLRQLGLGAGARFRGGRLRRSRRGGVVDAGADHRRDQFDGDGRGGGPPAPGAERRISTAAPADRARAQADREGFERTRAAKGARRWSGSRVEQARIPLPLAGEGVVRARGRRVRDSRTDTLIRLSPRREHPADRCPRPASPASARSKARRFLCSRSLQRAMCRPPPTFTTSPVAKWKSPWSARPPRGRYPPARPSAAPGVRPPSIRCHSVALRRRSCRCG